MVSKLVGLDRPAEYPGSAGFSTRPAAAPLPACRRMTLEIGLVLALVVIAIAGFVWEKFPPDVVALGVLVVIAA